MGSYQTQGAAARCPDAFTVYVDGEVNTSAARATFLARYAVALARRCRANQGFQLSRSGMLVRKLSPPRDLCRLPITFW